jgi:hypothetical protein
MSDLSGGEPIGRWANAKHPESRCAGHKKNGDQCGNPARRGTTVCDFHGAKAPQVKRKAQQRLDESADLVAMRELTIALNEDVPPAVALAACKDILDRTLGGAKQAVELSAKQPEPWEELLGDVAKITRAQHMAIYHPDQADLAPALPPAADGLEVVDAELVLEPRSRPPDVVARHRTPDDGRELPPGESATPPPSLAPPRALTQDEAADVMREFRPRTGPVRRTRPVRRPR